MSQTQRELETAREELKAAEGDRKAELEARAWELDWQDAAERGAIS